MSEFALPDLSPLVSPATEVGVRVLYGKVTALSPFAVLVDGDTTAVAAVACVNAVVDDRVVMLLQRDVLVAIGIVGVICPHAVGDYYLTENTTTPGTRWPGTTWVELPGRILVGRDPAQTEFDTIGEQGGHKELQSHRHLQLQPTSSSGGQMMVGVSAAGSGAAPNDNTAYTGSGDSGNLQPYRVCYVWRRTA
ncbi:MAG: phage baseplate protein [Coriobacteriia bacterium]